jgi:TonB-dependent receptor-like protein
LNGRSLLLAGALLATATAAAAQADSTRRPPRDTTPGAPHDSTPPRDTTAAFLPTFPTPVARGPLPLGTRYTFTLDSLVFTNAATLSDLLLHIPGVYVARGGLYGAPEIALYGGRGAQGLEVYWDGMPYLPQGRDAVYLDPARISLAMLERVDVEVLPAALRVYLVSTRPRSTIASSEVRIETGDYSIADYRGGFHKRWRSGSGLSIGADWNAIDGVPGSSSTAFNSVDLWLKGEFVPSPRGGVSYQLLTSSWDRSALAGAVERWKVTRQDRQLRFFLAPRPGAQDLGPRFEATFASTSTAADSVAPARDVGAARFGASDAWRRATVSASATLGGPSRRSRIDAQAAWMPLRFVTISADARRSAYSLGRTGERAHLAAGLRLPLGFSARGEMAWGKDLDSPTIPGDTAQRTSDIGGAVRWDSRFASLEVGRVRRDPFAPVGFAAALTGRDGLNALSPTPRSEFVTVTAALRPLPGLTISGWYFDPVVGGGDFEPPYHGRLSVTFFSKFWRRFRSGAFALRGEYALESWSTGTGGARRDSLGAATALPLPGASFSEFNLQLQIVGVTAFWVQRNSNFFRGSYVRGLDYPRRVQFFGVRWIFTN